MAKKVEIKIMLISGTSHEFSLLTFHREIIPLLKSGMSISHALAVLAGQEKNSSSHCYRPIIDKIYEGYSFPAALAKTYDLPVLYRAMIKSVDGSGSLIPMLERYLQYQEQSDEIKQQIISALLYPVFLMGFGFIIIIFLLFVIIPRFSAVYTIGGGEPPFLTHLVLSWGNFVNSHPMWFMLGLFGIAVLAYRLYQTGVFKKLALRVLFGVPLFRKRYELFWKTRWLRGVGLLTTSGITIHKALVLSSSIVEESQEKVLTEIIQSVHNGDGFYQSLDRYHWLDSVSLSMIRVGENSGDLGGMLEKVAEQKEKELTIEIRRFLKIIEPSIMVVTGTIIGVLVLLLYLPIFDIASSI
ncbi:MAG: type II secretion system F family protein [Methylacidiphilales bacterium]|nr:type II secretion system F family protein [Candidatus Methylacidiphilales bacterium]